MARTTTRKKPIELLSPEEVQALLQHAGRGLAGLRNRALVALLYRAGLRLAEALALMPKDLDLSAGQVHVLRGKGGKQRRVAIDAGGAAIVAHWLEARREVGLNGRHPVLCTISRGEVMRPGQPLKQQYVDTMLKRLAERAGLEKRIHPHGLRHTHAAELEREGKPVSLISKQLGHRSLATTMAYLDHLSPTERIERLRDRPEWSA